MTNSFTGTKILLTLICAKQRCMKTCVVLL